MSAVLLLIGIAASDAIADLWRVISRGPASGFRVFGRLLGETAARACAVLVWLVITGAVAAWWSPSSTPVMELWPTLALGFTPLLLSGLCIAPHIGPVVYLGLHLWTVIRLTGRLHLVSGLAVFDSMMAVLAGAIGYWVCRRVRIARDRIGKGSTLMRNVPCP